jgi:hypothetical protein
LYTRTGSRTLNTVAVVVNVMRRRPSDGIVYDRGRADGERAGVVFADSEHVQAVLLGEDAVANDVVDAAGRCVVAAGVDVGE